jgi:hypothetical protein
VTVAERLDMLIKEREAQTGKRWHYRALAEATGGGLSAGYLWRLRAGTVTDASLSTLETLGRLFNVPICAFASSGQCQCAEHALPAR